MFRKVRKLAWLAVVTMPMQATAQVPIGRIESRTSGAGFTPSAVWGPCINVTQRKDGSWAGTFVGQVVDLENQDGHLIGPNIDIKVEETADETLVHGYFFWLHLDVRMPHGQAMPWEPDSIKVGEELGHWGRFRFEGAAAHADPPIVPFVLALLAAQ